MQLPQIRLTLASALLGITFLEYPYPTQYSLLFRVALRIKTLLGSLQSYCHPPLIELYQYSSKENANLNNEITSLGYDASVLEEKLSFKMLRLIFSSKLDLGFLNYLYC